MRVYHAPSAINDRVLIGWVDVYRLRLTAWIMSSGGLAIWRVFKAEPRPSPAYGGPAGPTHNFSLKTPSLINYGLDSSHMFPPTEPPRPPNPLNPPTEPPMPPSSPYPPGEYEDPNWNPRPEEETMPDEASEHGTYSDVPDWDKGLPPTHDTELDRPFARVRHSTTQKIRIQNGATVQEVISALHRVSKEGLITLEAHIADPNDQRDQSWIVFKVEG